MRRSLCVLFFLLGSLLSATNLPSKNYLREGDFSDGLNGWHFFAGKNAGSIVSEGPQGGRCFKLSGAQESGIYLYNKSTTQGWSIDLEEGETYTFSCWLKTEKLRNTFSGNFLFLINHGWTQSVAFGAEETTAGWVKKEWTFKAPPQSKTLTPAQYRYSFLLYWPKGAEGSIWLSQMQIERGDKATEFTPLWNHPVGQVREQLEKCLNSVQKTAGALEKKFPNAAQLRKEIQDDQVMGQSSVVLSI